MTFEIVRPRTSFNPRHLRKGATRNGTVGPEKGRAFRAAAQYSKRFIHQSASVLESGRMSAQYAEYRGICDRQSLRKGK